MSRETVSKITDSILAEMAEWCCRPLERVYPVICIDAIVVKFRDGQVVNRPIYTAIGVTHRWHPRHLGLVGRHRRRGRQVLQVLTEIKNRGVDDACIVVCDGLKALPEAVEATWPLTTAQTSACCT